MVVTGDSIGLVGVTECVGGGVMWCDVTQQFVNLENMSQSLSH